MNDCLIHRGPDEAGIHIDDPVGLAHRRLSIVGLDTGRQPIFNEDGSIAVIFNGEIYNYESLQDELREQGHKFTTDTDTEVLVHLYEEHGDAFVQELEGMFAFALWDGLSERLLLARDPMGIKPLYLGTEPDGRIAFASELSALFPIDFDVGELDSTAIAEYFAFGFIPHPRSAFTNVAKIRPGELVEICDGSIHRSQFYTPNIDPIKKSLGDASQELRHRLEKAVKTRLQSDVPLGAFLSGGIDSSVITGLMAEVRDEPVKTFSIGFNEKQFDETWAAQEVASYHNTDHHEYNVTPSDVREVINEVIPTFGEPFAASSVLPTYVVSQKTSNDVTVALSGDGADELFSGYKKYRGEYYSRYYRVIPESLRQNLVRPAVDRLPASRGTRFGNRFRQVQKFARSSDSDISSRQFQWMARSTSQTAPAIEEMDVQKRGINRIKDAQDDAVAALPEERQNDLAVIQMADVRFDLPNDILPKVDRASMLNSLEVRVPFLDTDVFEFAMGLPTSYKITPTKQKVILKRAFDDLLPQKILDRGKQGFEIPIGEWFKNELRSEFIETLRNSRTDIIDTEFVCELYSEHVNGSRDHTAFLWAVFVFLKWHEQMRQRGIINT